MSGKIDDRTIDATTFAKSYMVRRGATMRWVVREEPYARDAEGNVVAVHRATVLASPRHLG